MGIIAANAESIIVARQKGLKPAGLILVSLVGRITERNHTVYAKSGVEYDWRWVRGLQICIYASQASMWRPVANAIAAERPAYLALWDAYRHQGTDIFFIPHVDDIEKPKSEWRWKLDFLPWLPFQNEVFAWN